MSESHRFRPLLIGVVVAVVIVAVIGAIYLLPAPKPEPNCNPAPPNNLQSDGVVVLVSCHTAVDLIPHSYTGYQVVRVTDGEFVEGQYAGNLSSDSSFHLFIVNQTDFANLPSAPTSFPSSYFWSATTDTDGNFSIQVPGSPNLYYVVLENIGSGPISITWTETLVVYYVPPHSNPIGGSGGVIGTPGET
jgi:hypothetical protein